MERSRKQWLALTMVAVAGCSATEPASPPAHAPVEFGFSGSGDPATGALVFDGRGPIQAAFGAIPVDADGNPATAAPGTVQVYAAPATVAGDATGGVRHTASGCTNALSLHGSVALLSSFPERLVNVHARFDNIAPAGVSLCPGVTMANPGFPELDPNRGLIAFPNLDQGVNTRPVVPTTIDPLDWSFDLPTTASFTFRGKIYADIWPPAPADPTVNGVPLLDGATISVSQPFTLAFSQLSAPVLASNSVFIGDTYAVVYYQGDPNPWALHGSTEFGTGTNPVAPMVFAVGDVKPGVARIDLWHFFELDLDGTLRDPSLITSRTVTFVP